MVREGERERGKLLYLNWPAAYTEAADQCFGITPQNNLSFIIANINLGVVRKMIYLLTIILPFVFMMFILRLSLHYKDQCKISGLTLGP